MAFNVGVVRLPETACAPVQPPEAVQLVALLEDQVSFAVAPLAIVAGEALIVTVGAAATKIVTDCVVVPVAPVQVSA